MNIYRLKYLLIEQPLWEIKLAWQRVFRGYDDTMSWNLETHLADLINKITLDMADNGHGHPDKLTEKKWKEILQQISFGFGSYMEMRSGCYTFKDKEYKRLEKEYKKGMELFAKYFPYLWD